MAEQEQAGRVAAWPNPPPFYEHFTPENIQRIDALREEQKPKDDKPASEKSNASIRIFDLPPELRFLQPPEPPANGEYRAFGGLWRLDDPLPTLEAGGVQQLYTPPGTPSSGTSGPEEHFDRALILKRIAKSLLLNFLELMGIMSINPDLYQEKVHDIRALFINFHHLLNEYRPHQARESLIMMMESQLARSKSETEGIKNMKAKVEGILAGLGQMKLADGASDEVQRSSRSSDDFEDEKEVWDELRREFG